MARTTQVQSIDSQIAEYVSGLSANRKKAVLTVVKSIADADHEAEFEKKWAKAITVEEARKRTLAFIDTLKWGK